MASLRQIHSSLSLVANQHVSCVGEGDALIAQTPGVVVSVRTADCFPILLADTVRRAVAAIHAGWRGTAASIAMGTLRHMSSEFGTDPADIVAAIGPGIGACCYGVGEDVARQFGLASAGRLDLASENVLQLVSAGVPQASIEVLNACTFCNAGLFHSWRRDGTKAERMVSFIGVNPALTGGAER